MRVTILDEYPDYGITKTGRVYSRKSGKWKELKPQIDTDGYSQVRICSNGLKRLTFVHRLVAETFLKRPFGKSEVNHINGDKTNNNIRNLEWCNRSENMLHAHDSGLLKTRTAIIAINISTGKEIRFKGQHEASRILGINQGNINHALKRNGSYKGYKFIYDEEVI